jgi:carbon monoxide dehydrogenase subunit G
MRVEGTKVLSAPVDRVWEVLNDPEQLARTLPGVESFSIEDATHWTAQVKVPLGLGGLKLRFRFEKLEERAPEHARLSAKGQGVGAIIAMDTSFDLAPDGPDRTSMAWQADIKVAGQVGAMGQRVFAPIVNQQVENVLASLDAQVAEGARGAEAGIHPASPEAYSTEPRGPTQSTSDGG